MSALRTPTGLRTIARISARNPSNMLKEVSTAHLRDAGNVLRDVASVGGITVVASPDSASGYANSHSPIRISTNSVTAVASGTLGSPSYSWACAGGVFEPINATAQTTAFRTIDTVSPSDTADDTASCTVTIGGQTGLSNTVNLFASNYGT
jgi:hypothetical protein